MISVFPASFPVILVIYSRNAYGINSRKIAFTFLPFLSFWIPVLFISFSFSGCSLRFKLLLFLGLFFYLNSRTSDYFVIIASP